MFLIDSQDLINGVPITGRPHTENVIVIYVCFQYSNSLGKSNISNAILTNAIQKETDPLDRNWTNK